MKNMASIRGYKLNGRFNSRIFNTCPGYPKIHDTFGEQTCYEPSCDEQDQRS